MYRWMYILVSFLLFSGQVLAKADEKTNACDLGQVKADKMIQASFNVEDDPVGLALEAKNNKNGKDLLNEYAKKHSCTLYVLSMENLVKGLLKGANFDNLHMDKKGASKENKASSTDNKGNKFAEKYILIQERKFNCAKELGLKLPLDAINPH